MEEINPHTSQLASIIRVGASVLSRVHMASGGRRKNCTK